MGLRLSPAEHAVYVFGEKKSLTRPEFCLLHMLMQCEGETVSYKTLESILRRASARPTVSLPTVIRRLRQKLFRTKAAGKVFIENKTRRGYKIPGRRRPRRATR